MEYNPEIHHRRSIRFKGYDYSETGAYFVTIGTQNRECLFGVVCDEKILLNGPGEMVLRIWNELPFYYNRINIDEFQIMPNHIHGIIVITDSVGAGPCACPTLCRPDPGQPQGVVRSNQGNHRGLPLRCHCRM